MGFVQSFLLAWLWTPRHLRDGILCTTPSSMRSFRADGVDKANDRAQAVPAHAHRLFADRRPGIPDVQSVLSAPERYQLRACRGSRDAVHSLGPVMPLCACAQLCIPPPHLQ